MKYFPDKEEYELSDGTIVSAEYGVIGMSEELVPREGCSGTFERCERISDSEDVNFGQYRYPEFTSNQKKEISAYMIGLWIEYAKT